LSKNMREWGFANLPKAIETLQAAQIETEELYISADEEKD